MPANPSTSLNNVTPSGAAESIRTLRGTGISLYIHGGPGMAKSAVARQVADQEEIAFIDLRLSQLAPEDVRGVPMPTTSNLMQGVIWIPPLVFPRDLDFTGHTIVDDTTGIAEVKFHNPVGNNGIHYCSNPIVEIETEYRYELTVRPDGFTVRLFDFPDPNYNPSAAFRWSVTGKAEGILTLEEFNSATPSVMAAAYQLVLDRRIGDYVVPDGVMILALGNRDSDRGVTYQLPKPVANRFIHLNMYFDWDDWFAWAGANGVHPEVLGYLSKWPSKINSFEADSPHLSFATPRSWEFVSKLINQPRAPSNDVMRALICGAIGDAIGAEFIQHRKFMESMPNVADILSGKVTKFAPADSKHEMQIAYSVCVQMCYELHRRFKKIEQEFRDSGAKTDFNKSPARLKWMEETDRGFAYAVANFRPDVTIMAARLMVVVHRLKLPAALVPNFAKFVEEYQPVLF